MSELIKIYETFKDFEGREITIGEYAHGYIAAFHDDLKIGSSFLEDRFVDLENDFVLININILAPYEHPDLTELMFRAAEFYYGDFYIEEGFRQELTELFKVSNKAFKHLAFATTTDEKPKC